MTKIAETNAARVPTTISSRLEVEISLRFFSKSKAVAAKIVGMAKKKENSVATLRLNLSKSAPIIVAPEREVPGIIARH